MSRKRHYLKISYTVAAWVPGGAKGDWQTEIWRDITSNGREVVIESLPPNARGDRSALHGDRFCVEIGRDRDRRDTVFLMRVQAAEARLPRSCPVTLKTELLQWPGGFPTELDDVDDLFFQTEPSEAPMVARVESSPLLWSLLGAMPASIRQRFRPGTDIEEPKDPTRFLLPLRQLWSRHRLDRLLRLSPRQDLLLRTQTTPNELPRFERDALLDAFGLGLLNELALVGQPALQAVLESLAAISIAPELRATVWAGTLEQLEMEGLRRELHAGADALGTLNADEPTANAWQRAAIPTLTEIATRQDEVLRDLLADASDNRNPFALLGEWAGKLAFSDAALAQAPPSPVEPAPGPTLVLSTTSSGGSVADEWVMKLRLPEEQPLEQFRDALVEAAGTLRSDTSGLMSVDSLLYFDKQASLLAALAARWREAIGDVVALRADLDECQTAYRDLEAVLGSDAAHLVRKNYILPAEAHEIALLLGHRLLPQTPDWLCSVGADTEQPPRRETTLDWAHLLVHNQRRRCVQMFCDLATELNEPQAVAWLTPPEPGGDPEAHLREWFERVRTFLLELPIEMRELLGGAASFDQIREEAAQMRALRAALPEAIWPEMEREFREIPSSDQKQLVGAYGRAVTFFQRELDGCEGLPYATIRARATKELALAAVGGVGEPRSTEATVTVEHSYLEGRTSRATLIYVPSGTGEDYGTVAVPLTLETGQPRALSIRLDWQFKGTARAGWSQDWPEPEPGRDDVVSVPIVEWRKQPDGKRWHFSIAARLPIRQPKEAHPRVEADVSVLDAETGRPLGPSRTLKWESIGLKSVSVSVVWGDATVPNHVRDHPIGPQERADALCERFAAGSNVAVIAPRRFGKSTLVEYLVREGNKASLCVPPAVVCTKYRSAAGFDYESLWKDLSDLFVDKLGVRLKYETSASLLPADAFDPIRTAAKKKAHKAIVVLLDEAQLFFTGPKGELGSQFKTLLERSLSRTDDRKKAPVVFGLIGLPSLRERGGADLMGMLNPVEKSRMDEAELRPLIAKMTTGLQTTHGARQQLADTAGNLLILKALLESLATRASRDRRLWVNYDDVVAVEELLKKELSEGRGLTVATYVRDVLNAADSVDDWRPVPSLAVAAAWARTWAPGRPDDELHERTLGILNEWCRLSRGAGDHGVRPVYTMGLLRQHLDHLRARQVLGGAEFTSPLLRAWLAGVAGRRSFDDKFRHALFSGAQRRIRLPSGAAVVARGAEAVVWRAGDYAYRVRPLDSPEQREQFQESVSMLEGLRQVVTRREIGSDHIFDLIEMGLAEKNEREAIQVYRWVGGQNLELRVGALAEDKVIEIGVKITRAVRLLHRNGLLHRDICPRNIVLDDVSDPSTVRPVLIDFGFARMVTTTMRSAYAGPHIAPEIRKTLPEWGRPADIYALAWSLESLLDKSEPSEELRKWIAQGMADSPERRPTAEQLLEGLEQLETEHKLAEHREQAWRDLWATVREHRHLPWFSAQMNKFREPLVSVWLKHYRLPRHRYGVIADFLNQLTETAPSVKQSLWALGLRDNDRNLKTLGAVRNQFAHGGNLQIEEQRVLVKKFESAGTKHQLSVLLGVVRKASAACQLASLPALGERLVD